MSCFNRNYLRHRCDFTLLAYKGIEQHLLFKLLRDVVEERGVLDVVVRFFLQLTAPLGERHVPALIWNNGRVCVYQTWNDAFIETNKKHTAVRFEFLIMSKLCKQYNNVNASFSETNS